MQFMQLPDYLRQQAVRAMQQSAMPAPCGADVAELLRKVKDLDMAARSDLLRECQAVCRESEAYRARAIRSNGKNKRMVLVATGLSPPYKQGTVAYQTNIIQKMIPRSSINRNELYYQSR